MFNNAETFFISAEITSLYYNPFVTEINLSFVFLFKTSLDVENIADTFQCFSHHLPDKTELTHLIN